MDYKIGSNGDWIEPETSPLIRDDIANEPLEVGIYQTSSTDVATTTVGNFSIQDQLISASGFE